jgi:hypothetical protein
VEFVPISAVLANGCEGIRVAVYTVSFMESVSAVLCRIVQILRMLSSVAPDLLQNHMHECIAQLVHLAALEPSDEHNQMVGAVLA